MKHFFSFVAVMVLYDQQPSDAMMMRRRIGNVFQALLEDFEHDPKDQEKFTGQCSGLIGKLLPNLRREYTSRQVPDVLYHECDVYHTRTDFHKGNMTAELETWQCRHFAGSLVNEFLGGKDYKGWCSSFFTYLQQKVKSPAEREAERQKLLKEKQALQDQLDKLHEQWQKKRAHLAKDGIKQMKKSEEEEEADIKDQLERLTKELQGGPMEGFDDADASKLDKQLDYLEDEWAKKKKKCCPSGCRMCEVEAEEDEEDDEDEDEDDEESEENMPKQAKASLIARRGNHGGFFHAIVSEYEKLPEKPKFVERCTATIEGLMPKLRTDYTSKMVPTVLEHDCDVYSTTTDFKVKGMKLEHAAWNCRHFAGKLGHEFESKKPEYSKWCGSVWVFFDQEMNRKKSEGDAARLVKERDALKKQLKELKKGFVKDATLPCCPAGCKPC